MLVMHAMILKPSAMHDGLLNAYVFLRQYAKLSTPTVSIYPRSSRGVEYGVGLLTDYVRAHQPRRPYLWLVKYTEVNETRRVAMTRHWRGPFRPGELLPFDEAYDLVLRYTRFLASTL